MSDDAAFIVGDAVRLRVDGSPRMIVAEIDAEGRIVCDWTDGAGTTKRHAFPPRSLRAVENAPTISDQSS